VIVADVVVKQVRSANGANPKQRETLRSLRLGKIGRSVTLVDNTELRGMLRVVDHLVIVDGQRASTAGQAAEKGS
jgi:large subunit ribosomal protein L30